MTPGATKSKNSPKAAKPKPAAKAKAPAKRAKPAIAKLQPHAQNALHIKPPPKGPPSSAPHKPPKAVSAKYYFATGRRKTAVANVRLFEGSGDLVVNKKPFGQYFFHAQLQTAALKPLELLGLAKSLHFTAQIKGGGIKAQAQALQHGLAQAVSIMNKELRKQLKKAGFLTRDDRKKERKKPGLKRARRAPQWAKR